MGETFEDTARRESLEETGFIVGEMHLFCLHSGEVRLDKPVLEKYIARKTK